ncbi:MAG TPA: ABC transporter permease subunit [Herpetosiphonaceae bacterium]
MFNRHMRIITGRDVRDSFSDWRTVAPLIVLSLLLPLALSPGVRYVSDFLEQQRLTEVLVPFGMLIAGFLPASFSLIGPLESFVGERERNTLESLLSAPISDRSLYLGKFIASITPPLISSFIAMSVYALRTRGSARFPAFASALTWDWILIVMGLIFIKAVVMVSAAVYISSQSTSIRAANLLASFILIPMTLVVQTEAFLFINKNFQAVGLITLALVGLGGFFLAAGLTRFNREEVLAREHRPVSGRDGASVRGRISERRYGPIITIARREIRDTLTDWRILTPISVLTLLVPAAAVPGTIFAIGFVEEPDTITRLMPFILLMVGFLPASFSLITALEVFVGEKERGSLESLFSMPVGDRQLYLGKLISALLPPLCSGLVAMVLFIGGFVLTGRTDMLGTLTPLLAIGMLALMTAKAVTMVAGAVIISSHTSSVRVANLLASFILLPMSIVIQLEAIVIIGQRFDLIGWSGLATAVVGLILVRSGMQSFNRESILSREHLSLSWEAIIGAFQAFFREVRPAGADPDLLSKELSLSRFYRKELKVIWRELRLPLVVVLIGVAAAVIYAPFLDPENTRQFSRTLVNPRAIGQVIPLNPLQDIPFLFIGNTVRIAFTGLLSAVSFGIFSWMVPSVAFLAVAKSAWWSENHAVAGGAMAFLLAYVVPHGVIELPTAILMAAAGVRVGAATVSVPPTYTVGRHLLWALAMYFKLLVFVGMPLLLLSAILESTVMPLATRAVFGQ